MKNFIPYLLGLLICLDIAGNSHSMAAPVTVKAKLDSVQILMGKMTMLRLEVVKDKNSKGEFEFLKGSPADGVVPVCGDSVELRTAVKRDTTDLGSGRIQINYAVPVQSFDSGFYLLPQLRYINGKDTSLSNSVSLKVIPVAVNKDAAISGYADVMDPAESSIFDYVPDWIADYWWLWLAAAVIAAATIYLIYRFRNKGSILPKKPEKSPYEVAVSALNNLKQRKLWENGMEREYFTELTEILRIYLDRRFGINAMEMTSRQIISKLSEDRRIKDKRDYVRQVLDMADYVKFAAMRPLPDDNVKAYDNAMRFIEETKPEPEETKKEDDGFEIEDEPQKPAEVKKKGGDK